MNHSVRVSASSLLFATPTSTLFSRRDLDRGEHEQTGCDVNRPTVSSRPDLHALDLTVVIGVKCPPYTRETTTAW